MNKVLVLGGYGNFGQTICLLLAQDADIRLLIGGRDGARAADFAASRELGSTQPVYIMDTMCAELPD